MRKVKWPKMPHYLVPLFENANIYLATSREVYQQANQSVGCDVVDLAGYSGICSTLRGKDSGTIIIMIGVFDCSMSTLAHEVCHAAFDICDDAGVMVEQGNANETFCYLVSRIFEKFKPHILEEA